MVKQTIQYDIFISTCFKIATFYRVSWSVLMVVFTFDSDLEET